MKRVGIVAGALGALVVGLFAIAAAGAQEATPSPTDVVGEANGVLGTFKEKLAENLGISEDELDAAMDETQIEMIDDALANGLIDEERAADLKARIENGEDVPFPFLGGRPHPGHFPRIVVGIVDNASDVLGMELDDLAAELRDGKSMADVAQGHGMSVEDFTAGLLEAIKADLDQKAAGGDLPQEKADEIYARLSENIDDIVNRTPGEGHPGPLGEFHGPVDGGFPRPGGPFSGEQEEASLTIDA